MKQKPLQRLLEVHKEEEEEENEEVGGKERLEVRVLLVVKEVKELKELKGVKGVDEVNLQEHGKQTLTSRRMLDS